MFQTNLGYVVRPEGTGVLDGVKMSLIYVCVPVLFFVVVYSYFHVSIFLLQCYYFSHFVEGKSRLEGFEKLTDFHRWCKWESELFNRNNKDSTCLVCMWQASHASRLEAVLQKGDWLICGH